MLIFLYFFRNLTKFNHINQKTLKNILTGVICGYITTSMLGCNNSNNINKTNKSKERVIDYDEEIYKNPIKISEEDLNDITLDELNKLKTFHEILRLQDQQVKVITETEKLNIQIQQLNKELNPNRFNNILKFILTNIPIFVAAGAFVQWITEQKTQRQTREDENFQNAADGLEKDDLNERIVASNLLYTYLSSKYKKYHYQLFNLTVGSLRNKENYKQINPENCHPVTQGLVKILSNLYLKLYENISNSLKGDMDETEKSVSLALQTEEQLSMSGVYLDKSYLISARFMNANFRQASFKGCTIKNCFFNNSNLESSNFDDTNLMNANFSQANFEKASLESAELSNVNLKDSNLRNSILKDTNFNTQTIKKNPPTNLTNADLTDAIVNENTKFQGAIVKGVKVNEKIKTQLHPKEWEYLSNNK